jgi:hypothetical protein
MKRLGLFEALPRDVRILIWNTRPCNTFVLAATSHAMRNEMMDACPVWLWGVTCLSCVERATLEKKKELPSEDFMWRAVAYAKRHFDVFLKAGDSWRSIAMLPEVPAREKGFLSQLWARVQSSPTAKLSLVGLDASGKTTFAWKVRDIGEDYKIPQMRCWPPHSKEEYLCWLGNRKAQLEVLELPGQEKLRFLLHRVALPCAIYMVDSHDRERLAEARRELHWWCSLPSVKAVLVVCNKQDLPNSMRVPQLIEALSVSSLPCPFFVVGACALALPGKQFDGAIRWLWGAIEKFGG